MKNITISILICLQLVSCSLLPGGKSELRPQQVIDAFAAANLEVVDYYTYTADDYKKALFPLPDELIHFYIPSLCADCGGRVFYYADKEYLDKCYQYYEKAGKNMAALRSWLFVRDHILVQINGDLPEAQARQYEDALKAIP